MANPVTTTTKKTLVLGTAGQGPSGVAYPVTNPTQAAADFGLAGDLVQGMEEVRAYCDNITCYRLGTKAGTLTGVGLASWLNNQVFLSLSARSAPDQTRHPSPATGTQAVATDELGGW